MVLRNTAQIIHSLQYLVIQVVITLIYLLQSQVPVILHMHVRVELPRGSFHQLHRL